MIKAVTLLAAGNTAATGLISANVAALTEGVVKSILLTKLKSVTTLMLMLSMVTLTSAMVLAWGLAGPASIGDKGNGVEQPAANAEKQDFTNSIGMKFAWIPSGSFMMGSPKEEKERNGNEPQHKVTLTKGFYMGVYAVTQEQWKAVMGDNPSRFKGEKNLPVETVSWDDCQEFVKKLREKDQKAYRLPTEAEWEYCCRAGTKTPFHFGDTISADQANYHGDYTYGDGKKGVFSEENHASRQLPCQCLGASRHARQCFLFLSGLVRRLSRKRRS